MCVFFFDTLDLEATELTSKKHLLPTKPWLNPIQSICTYKQPAWGLSTHCYNPLYTHTHRLLCIHTSSLAFSGTQTEETSWAIQLTSNVSVDIIGGQLKRQKLVLSLITDVLKQINGECSGEERVGKKESVADWKLMMILLYKNDYDHDESLPVWVDVGLFVPVLPANLLQWAVPWFQLIWHENIILEKVLQIATAAAETETLPSTVYLTVPRRLRNNLLSCFTNFTK